MLELLITFLNSRLAALDLFSELPGLVQLVQKQRTDEGKIFPAVYCGKGEYQELSIDQTKAIVYFRETAPAVIADDDENASRGCSTQEIRTYNLVCVGLVPKDVYNTDNAYIDDKIAMNVKKALTISNDKTIRQLLGADYIMTQVTAVETDRNNIIEQEYAGVDITMDYKNVYFSIEFEFAVGGQEECFQSYGCNDELFVPNFSGVQFLYSTEPFITY